MKAKLDFKSWLINYLQGNNFGIKKEEIESGKDSFANYIFYQEDMPYDSYDRMYALYLLDVYPDMVKDFSKMISNNNANKVKDSDCYALMDKYGIKEEFLDVLTPMSYDNFEREGINPVMAFYNMLFVAVDGKDAVLKDAYTDGGWFGGI